MKTAIITDSNSGITQATAKELGISVVPMPVLIDGEQYYEDLTLTQDGFYEKLQADANVSTSQPNPIDVGEIWAEALKTHDSVIYIPMSSGLSESCHTAEGLAKQYGGRVCVADNQRISVTQKQSVYDAIKLAAQGLNAADIAKRLIETKFDSSIYISLDTLKYLKKGGRLTPAAALIGTILKIKPVLQIQGEKLDAFKKVHTLKQAKDVMTGAVKHDLETRFSEYVKNKEIALSVAHTNNYAEAEKFKAELENEFPGIPVDFVDPLSLSVSCHIGPGALAVTCQRILK